MNDQDSLQIKSSLKSLTVIEELFEALVVESSMPELIKASVRGMFVYHAYNVVNGIQLDATEAHSMKIECAHATCPVCNGPLEDPDTCPACIVRDCELQGMIDDLSFDISAQMEGK